MMLFRLAKQMKTPVLVAGFFCVRLQKNQKKLLTKQFWCAKMINVV